MIQILIHLILSLFSHADREGELRAAVAALPDVRIEEIDYRAVSAALAAETPRVRAELLIAIAWAESRLDPTVRTGRVCGVMQVNPADIGEPRAACDAWRADMAAAFRAGVLEIETMLAEPRVRGDLHAALLYRACGNAAFSSGCSRAKHAWVAAVERLAIAIRHHTTPRT